MVHIWEKYKGNLLRFTYKKFIRDLEEMGFKLDIDKLMKGMDYDCEHLSCSPIIKEGDEYYIQVVIQLFPYPLTDKVKVYNKKDEIKYLNDYLEKYINYIIDHFINKRLKEKEIKRYEYIRRG